MEKMEQSKEFIEEVERLRNEAYSLHNALNTVNFTDFPNLKIFLHDAFKNNEQLNQDQITFAKIWAGEIELVEKKPKYVIWAKGSLEGDRAEFLYNNALHAHISAAILRKTEAADDKECHFDQEFAFALRDTKRFEIDKVVE